MSAILLAYVAGVVTILSPCVLPLLPIVLGGALGSHRHGPLALAAGLVSAFTLFGLLIATVGFAIGLTPKLLNQIGAMLMIAAGLVLISEQLQTRFAIVAASASGALNARVSSFAPEGLIGQFALGALLGLVWTPCVGPTLGAAIALASSGQAIGYAALIMFAFAVGTATPLVAIMTMSREALQRRRGALAQMSTTLKPMLGLLLMLVGFAFLTGLMTEWEALLLDYMPSWLTTFIYSF